MSTSCLSLKVIKPLTLRIIRESEKNNVEPRKCRPRKYNLDIFLSRAKEIHGNKYDYSEVTEEHIVNVNSRVPVRCTICARKWTPSISTHITQKYGCASCSGTLRWTFERFMVQAREVHGNKFNYDEILSSHIVNKQSRIPVTCRQCEHQWTPTVEKHINGKRGCPSCAGTLRWNLEKFLSTSRRIHGEKFNYDGVKEEHIINNKAKFPITCNICHYVWNITIDTHVNQKSGCPSCYGSAPWTLERLLTKAEEIHDDKFNYNAITKDDIKGKRSKIQVKCNTCYCVWYPDIDNHINGKTGCPTCHRSKGEKECAEVLSSLGISFESEITIDAVPRKRYDFSFKYKDELWLLEYDGKQHFAQNSYFDKIGDSFEIRQQNDLIKTKGALESGYRIIRIDYTKLRFIKTHILQALNSDVNLYLSDPDMYSYITKILY